MDVVIWSMIELFTAAICACLMCFRPLLVKCFPSMFPTATTTSQGNTTHSRILNPRWGQKINSKLAGKLQSYHIEAELLSSDDDASTKMEQRSISAKIVHMTASMVTIEMNDRLPAVDDPHDKV